MGYQVQGTRGASVISSRPAMAGGEGVTNYEGGEERYPYDTAKRATR